MGAGGKNEVSKPRGGHGCQFHVGEGMKSNSRHVFIKIPQNALTYLCVEEGGGS